MRKRIQVSSVTLGLAGLCLATAASAGEVRGRNGGELKPVNGRSECAYSGLNDEFYIDDEAAPRVQSYGQIVRVNGINPQDFNDPEVPAPIAGCNPTNVEES